MTAVQLALFGPPVVEAPRTAAEIEAVRTPAGGWTRVQLEQWGVSWPPPRGWKDRLLGIPETPSYPQAAGYKAPGTSQEAAAKIAPDLARLNESGFTANVWKVA
jgi:hypothetical protein